MSEKKLKHLEFIQNVITRMNANSFLLKGWAITLVSALFALAAKDANLRYVLITYLILPTFWILDGFFVSTERRYRDLYDQVCDQTEDQITFSMDASSFAKGNRRWDAAIFSKTLWPFYGAALIATLIVMFLMKE